jgi:hypothetical protein
VSVSCTGAGSMGSCAQGVTAGAAGSAGFAGSGTATAGAAAACGIGSEDPPHAMAATARIALRMRNDDNAQRVRQILYWSVVGRVNTSTQFSPVGWSITHVDITTSLGKSASDAKKP